MKKIGNCCLWGLAGPLIFVDRACAMHISEGILPFNWALFWYLLAIPVIAYGLKRVRELSALDLSFKPLLGFMAAVVFVISLMPVPVPVVGTCSHPVGVGISGIILGPAISSLTATVALLLQALFLAHGGLSTLGANVFAMGVVGSFTGYLTFRALRGLKASLAVSGFMAGLLADWATYFTTALELALGIRGDSPFLPLFTKILVAFIPTQLPLGILEGAITGGMLVLLNKKRPDLLLKFKILKPREVAV